MQVLCADRAVTYRFARHTSVGDFRPALSPSVEHTDQLPAACLTAHTASARAAESADSLRYAGSIDCTQVSIGLLAHLSWNTSTG